MPTLGGITVHLATSSDPLSFEKSSLNFSNPTTITSSTSSASHSSSSNPLGSLNLPGSRKSERDGQRHTTVRSVSRSGSKLTKPGVATGTGSAAHDGATSGGEDKDESGEREKKTVVTALEEIGSEVGGEGDVISCFVEVPSTIPSHPLIKSQTTTSNSSPNFPPVAPTQPTSSTLSPTTSSTSPTTQTQTYYAIYYRLSDLTYTHQVSLSIDKGRIKINKVHLGKTGPFIGTGTKNNGKIEGMPVTDDWSKMKGLRFEETTLKKKNLEELEKEEEEVVVEGEKIVDDDGEEESVGEIWVRFYRATAVKGGKEKEAKEVTKPGVSGFHLSGEGAEETHKPLEGSIPSSISHKTGLGPIIFSSPRKSPSVEKVDSRPFVTFVFKYRSRDHLPDHDWFIPSTEAAIQAEKEGNAAAAAASSGIIGDKDKDDSVKRSGTLAHRWTQGIKKTATVGGKRAQSYLKAVNNNNQREKDDGKKEGGGGEVKKEEKKEGEGDNGAMAAAADEAGASKEGGETPVANGEAPAVEDSTPVASTAETTPAVEEEVAK